MDAEKVARPRIIAEMLVEQIKFIPDLKVSPCCEQHLLEVFRTAIVNARADGRQAALEPCFCGVSGHFAFQQNGSSCLMCQREQRIATAAREEQREADAGTAHKMGDAWTVDASDSEHGQVWLNYASAAYRVEAEIREGGI